LSTEAREKWRGGKREGGVRWAVFSPLLPLCATALC